MKKILLSVLIVTNCYFVFAQSIPKVDQGSITRIENFNSKYVASRNIDIWLPQDYNINNKYAVLYMQDGQMLYDSNTTWNKKSWMLQDAITKLMNENKIKNVIVVGIWNGGERRHSEYFPKKPFQQLSKAQQAVVYNGVRKNNVSVFNNYELNADNYLKFIVEELKPFIDQKFSTQANFKNTFIGGSSMGGLISMYAICEYPKVFGGAICMSTHWPGIFEMENNPIPEAFINYLASNLPRAKNHKLYFDCGDKTLDALYPPIQNKVDVLLRNKGYSEKTWMTQYFPGQEHSEVAWAGRLQIPLAFILAK
jgi:predicted alpha/beta superfamily hydrolase